MLAKRQHRLAMIFTTICNISHLLRSPMTIICENPKLDIYILDSENPFMHSTYAKRGYM